jgi:hypothetical protein
MGIWRLLQGRLYSAAGSTLRGAFAGQTLRKQILDRRPVSIFELLDSRLLELEYMETLFQYITRKKGNINYISGYIVPELLRLCTRPQPLLIDNVWKV